jgi:hypothetical protein
VAALLAVNAPCSPVPVDGPNAFTLACPAGLAVAPGIRRPVLVAAAEVTPDGSGEIQYSWILWPGQPPVELPAPAAGHVWLVRAETVLRVEAVSGAWAVVGLAVWAIAGWQIGSWIGEGLLRRRR